MVDHGQGARRGESPDRTGPVVLVVEDDAANRALLETLLSRDGYRVVTMADGEAGFRSVGEHDPDLVLTARRVTD